MFTEDLHEAKEALADATRRFHELEIELRRVEGERDDWRIAYQDAESLRKQEEAKVIRLTAENLQIRQEYERRLHDQEEEFEALKYVSVRKSDFDWEKGCVTRRVNCLCGEI